MRTESVRKWGKVHARTCDDSFQDDTKQANNATKATIWF